MTARVGGQLIGVSLLMDSPFEARPDIAHLAFCGVVQPDLPAAADATSRLLASSLRIAAAEGWAVEIEANDGNRFLWDSLKALPGIELFSDMVLLVSRPARLE